MGQFGIGQPIKRFEDQRLLRGEGRFHNDVNLPGQTHAVIVRSTHAHARIRSIDTAAALASPGVVAVFTGADLARDNLGTMQMTLKRKRPDGSPMFASPHRGLTADRVRYVGDPVAMVIAETLAQAEDAAERLRIDYEPLPSVTSTAEAIGGPAVWDECADNVSNLFESGDKATTDAAFAKAHRVVRRRYVITRVHAQYMEPRGALGVWDPGEERYTLYADVQYPHRVRTALASNIFKVPEHSIRVIAGDVGRRLRHQGLAIPRAPPRALGRQEDPPARQVGVRAPRGHPRRRARARQRHRGGAGARRRGALSRPPGEDARQCRRLRLVRPEPPRHLQQCRHARRRLRVPRRPRRGPERPHEYQLDGPYRGAGRPEATYVLERLIDDAGRELGLDPVELRRKNLIPASAMPYKTPLGVSYDCGDFPKNMEDALKVADVAGFAARREASRARGLLRGIGIVNAIERAAGPQPEFAEVRFSPSGTATILMGSKNQGQNHETTFKQILHERLGIDPKDVRYIDGDTDRVAFGMGTMGSRSTVIGGTALWMAADKVIAKGKKIAAKMLEAAEADIAFSDGRFAVAGTDRGLTLREVARAAFQPPQLPPGVEPGLYETGTFSPKQDTWPNGCHVCELEIDPDTGVVTLDRYVVIDDVGTVINPVTLKGQIHGGVAQGVGQALLEQIVYEPESGQLLTSSFMEYAMPRADTFCDMHIESNPVPTKLNPMGAKGAGEAGTVGALPVVINAVMSALAPLGVRDLDMPASSERVWRAIQDAASATR
jgi:carbon-monoxide dehydrogenase large subunit